MKILSTEKFNSLETPKILSQIGEVEEFIQWLPNDCTPLVSYVNTLKPDILFVGLRYQINQFVMNGAKIVATRTTGLDHIDLEYCKKNDITVLSLRDEPEFMSTVSATAEWTFGNMLMLLRKTGHELQGKTLGIIGYGRIGKLLEWYAKAFGMKVIHCDKQSVPSLQNLTAFNLLKESDIVSLNITADEENRGYMNRAWFEAMKQGSWFINSARDWLVDPEALKWALENRLAGAWSDFPEHQAGKTIESLIKTEEFLTNKLVKYVNDRNNS